MRPTTVRTFPHLPAVAALAAALLFAAAPPAAAQGGTGADHRQEQFERDADMSDRARTGEPAHDARIDPTAALIVTVGGLALLAVRRDRRR